MFSKKNKSASKPVANQIVEINLIPDIKRELVKAQIVRSRVITGSILVSLSAGVLVVVLLLITFGFQGVFSLTLDRGIKDEFNRYKDYPGVNQIITVQNQLANIGSTHQDKPITSRLTAVIVSTVTGSGNSAQISKFSYDSTSRMVTIEGQSKDLYLGLERFQKSILATTFEFDDQGEKETRNITDDLEMLDTPSFAESPNSGRILIFKLGFVVDADLFASVHKDVTIKGPNRKDVTDGAIVIPAGVFVPREPGDNSQTNNQSDRSEGGN